MWEIIAEAISKQLCRQEAEVSADDYLDHYTSVADWRSSSGLPIDCDPGDEDDYLGGSNESFYSPRA